VIKWLAQLFEDLGDNRTLQYMYLALIGHEMQRTRYSWIHRCCVGDCGPEVQLRKAGHEWSKNF